MNSITIKKYVRIPAEELEVGMVVSINFTNVTVESITPVSTYALYLTLREHFGGSTGQQVYLSEKVTMVSTEQYAVYGPDVPVLDDRDVYCSGCEQYEYQGIMDEVLYEGGTMREARAHLAQYVRLITCDSCIEEGERYNY